MPKKLIFQEALYKKLCKAAEENGLTPGKYIEALIDLHTDDYIVKVTLEDC